MYLAQKQYYKSYDPGAAYFFGKLGGGDNLNIQGKGGVQTSGASTTVTATDGTPFDPVTVGSIIVFLSPRPDGKIIRTVTAKASGSSITVDTAVTLAAGAAFFFYPFKGGTADTDGWHQVDDFTQMTLYADLEVLGSTSIDLLIQSGGSDMGTPIQITTNPAAASGAVSVNLAAVGKKAIEILSTCVSLRVGVRAVGGPAVDAITIWLVGKQHLAA